MPGSDLSGKTHENLLTIPLSYVSGRSEKSALLLVNYLRPEWDHLEGPIEIVRFKDGITNTLLKITKKLPGKSVEQIDDDAILLRAYGNDTDILIDRERETQSHILLAERGLAPSLLARFNNGLLYKFIQGRVCTPSDLLQEEVWRGVSRRLAEFHSVPLPSNYYHDPKFTGRETHTKGNRNPHSVNLPRSKPTPNIWTVLQKWIDALPTHTEKERVRISQLQTELDRCSIDLDTKNSSAGGTGMVFGHCDLLSANVIILPNKTKTKASNSRQPEVVRFIDYEYATACPAAFDIANHFAEWGGYECDYAMLPNRKVRASFLEEYLRALSALPPTEDVRDDEIQALANQVDDFRGIPGLYWGTWALIQATISQIDFDYASYADARLGEYFAWRGEKDGSRITEGREMPLRERCWVKQS